MRLTGPLGYLDFLRLVEGCALALTDSGGLQEEATLLGVRCLTLRDGTERPATVLEGTNRVVGRDTDVIVASVERGLERGKPKPRVPPLWDGRAAERIVGVLLDHRELIARLHRGLRARTTCGRGLSPAA
jgi:UDP-N-acetylglucosamine 2-epimerase (non-hydrolysing)